MTQSTTEGPYDFLVEQPEIYGQELGTVSTVDIPELCYMTISGTGHLSLSKDFANARQAMSGIAFAIKFKMKRKNPEGYFEYAMPPAEAERSNISAPKEERTRKAMLMQPHFVRAADVIKARRVAHAKSTDTHLPQIEHEIVPAHKVIQTLHIGAYDQMDDKVALLKKYAADNNLTITGEHHEVYLNDLRRTKPDKLETIIRYHIAS